MPLAVNKPGELAVGQFFESCSFHPCLCCEVDSAGVQIEGISLIDGKIHYCNIRHCGLRLLSTEEAIQWKLNGPADKSLAPERQWWQ